MLSCRLGRWLDEHACDGLACQESCPGSCERHSYWHSRMFKARSGMISLCVSHCPTSFWEEVRSSLFLSPRTNVLPRIIPCFGLPLVLSRKTQRAASLIAMRCKLHRSALQRSSHRSAFLRAKLHSLLPGNIGRGNHQAANLASSSFCLPKKRFPMPLGERIFSNFAV